MSEQERPLKPGREAHVVRISAETLSNLVIRYLADYDPDADVVGGPISVMFWPNRQLADQYAKCYSECEVTVGYVKKEPL